MDMPIRDAAMTALILGFFASSWFRVGARAASGGVAITADHGHGAEPGRLGDRCGSRVAALVG